MKVRYTPRARRDLQDIFQYIDERSPNGARAVKHAIVSAIRLLESYPHMAPPTDEPHVRELIVPRRPYKVYYRIEGEDIWIAHIRDARRLPLEDIP